MLRKHALLFIVIFASLPLMGWWSYGLFDLDEGYYAAVTSEMNRLGEWVTPMYNGHPWYEKPILLYWAAKPCLALFGDMVGPRLPSVIASIATYALVGWFARRRIGETAAVIAVLALASSLLVVALGRMMMTDSLLLLALTAAFLTFWESLVGDSRWRLATAVCLGLGVLAKGPVTGVLFIPVAVWMWWRWPQLRPGFKGHWLAGSALFLLVVASWYAPAYLKDGQVFVQKFLIEQNVGRFAGGDEAHTVRGVAGLVFYIPIVLVGLAPWSFILPRAWRAKPFGVGQSQDLERSAEALQAYLKAWVLVVFVFFTITGAKLPHYVLPLAPPVALLVGWDLAARWRNRLTAGRLAPACAWLLFIAGFAQFGFSSWYYGTNLFGLRLPRDYPEIHALSRYVRDHAGKGDLVAEYKMGRQQKDMGTGKLKLQETAHPSTLLYMDRDILETDDWKRILEEKQPVWILTRWNRVLPQDVAGARGRLVPVATGSPQDYYRLYRLSPE